MPSCDAPTGPQAQASSSDTGSETYAISSMGPGEWNLIMHYRMWTPCTTYPTNPGCNADNDTIRVDFAKGLRVTVLGVSASLPAPALTPCPLIATKPARRPDGPVPHNGADARPPCRWPAERIATACASGFRLSAGKCVACPAGTFEYQTQACIPAHALHHTLTLYNPDPNPSPNPSPNPPQP